MEEIQPITSIPNNQKTPSLQATGTLRRTRSMPSLSKVTHKAVRTVQNHAKKAPVLQLQEELERLERTFETDKLALYKNRLVNTKHMSYAKDITKVQTALKKSEETLVKRFNEKTEWIFAKQKNEVLQLISRYNDGNEQALRTLQKLEHRIALRDASTSTLNINKTRVRLYAAVLHKRLARMKRKGELEHTMRTMSRWNPQRWKAARELSKIKATLTGRKGAGTRKNLTREINKLSKSLLANPKPTDSSKMFYARSRLQASDKELGALPPVDYLLDLHDEIHNELNDTKKLNVSYKRATALSKQHALQLDWGRDHLLTALHSPANWTITRRIALLRSASGHYHAFATEIEPLSHVPSGSREKRNGRTQPTNFQRTTFYRLGSKQKHLSYRGGQFPTPEAAKQAMQQMIDDGASDIHINSLLTPTALPGKKDRALLKTHYENIERTLADSTTSFSFTNFGVNEGAQGQLGPEIAKKLGLRGPRIDAALQGGGLGWHYATREFNNDGMEALNEKLGDTLRFLKQPKNDPEEEAKRQQILPYYPYILKVAKEIQSLWESNDFANSAAGNDPFKMPALLKVMDMMLGTTSYVNCMSGKDRTGETEAAAHHRFAEIEMAIEENPPQNNPHIAADINWSLTELGYSRHKHNKHQIDHKWVSPKQVSSSFLPGTVGIASDARKAAPTPSHDYHAANRRNMMAGSGAAAITLQNTAYAGSKVGGGTPLLTYGAGFDRDAILRDYSPEEYRKNTLYNKVGLSKERHKELELPQRAPSPKQLSRWLRKVAEHHRKIFKPAAKVKH